MSDSTLMNRAKLLMQKQGAKAALIIVPLALAVPAHAASVVFADGATAGINTTSGGFGHAFVTLTDPDNQHLSGDTIEPNTSFILIANRAQGDEGLIHFQWGGALDPGTDPVNSLQVALNVAMQGTIDPNAPIHNFGTASWILDVELYNVDDSDPDNPLPISIATYMTSGGGLNSALYNSTSGTGGANLVGSIDPQFWSADLLVQWNYDAPTGSTTPTSLYDQLSVTPCINVSLSATFASSTPPSPVPLPPAVWMGGLMIGGLCATSLGRKRKLRIFE